MSLQAKWSSLFWDCNFVQCLFPEAYIRLLTSIQEHPFPESMYSSTRSTRPQDTLAQRHHLPWWSLRHQDNCADHLSAFVGKTTTLFQLHGSDSWGDYSFIKKCLLNLDITMCTEFKTVTGIIYADHLNSVTSAIDVHFHGKYLTFLPPNPCSHTHLQS